MENREKALLYSIIAIILAVTSLCVSMAHADTLQDRIAAIQARTQEIREQNNYNANQAADSFSQAIAAQIRVNAGMASDFTEALQQGVLLKSLTAAEPTITSETTQIVIGRGNI